MEVSRNRFAFTGHYYDPETDLYNAKARYFDPKLGRFLTQDSFLGSHDNPPSLHRYAYGFNNPLTFVDPDGNESVRQAWGLDEPQGFWSAFGKNVAYNAWNAISFGTLGRQDTLVEQYEAGQISNEQYWGRTAINAGSSAAIAVAAAATGGAAAGVATGLGASATVAGVSAGVAGGLAAQATTDIIEVAGTRTKALKDVSAKDYLIAGATGGFLGGVGGAAATNPGAVRFNLNPNIRGLGALDDTLGRGTQLVQRPLARIAEKSYRAGQRTATTIVESIRPPTSSGTSALPETLQLQRELSVKANRTGAALKRWMTSPRTQAHPRYGRWVKTYQDIMNNPNATPRQVNFAKGIRGRFLDRRMKNWMEDTYRSRYPNMRLDQRVPNSGSNLKPDVYLPDIGGRRAIYDFGGASKVKGILDYQGLADDLIPIVPDSFVP